MRMVMFTRFISCRGTVKTVERRDVRKPKRHTCVRTQAITYHARDQKLGYIETPRLTIWRYIDIACIVIQ